MEIKVTRNPGERMTTAAGTFSDQELHAGDPRKFMQSVAQQVEQAIVHHVAERFLAEHLQEVVAAINPQAVANLALARAAQQIMERMLTPPTPVRDPQVRQPRDY